MRRLTLVAYGTAMLQLYAITAAQADSLRVKFNPARGTMKMVAQQADARAVVREVIDKSGGTIMAFDAGVTGRITMSAIDLAPHAVLRRVLNSVGGDYRRVGRTYHVYRPGQTGWLLKATGAKGPPSISVPNDPAQDVPGVPIAMFQPVQLSAANKTLGEIIRGLGRQTGVVVRLDRGVPADMRINMVSKRDTLWEAIGRLALATHLKVDVVGHRALALRPLKDFSAWYKDRQKPAAPATAAAVGTCPNCRFERRQEWRFCPNCGESYSSQSQPRTPAPASAPSTIRRAASN